jgi:pimeloyl-ACP methyl ester carboxylesterase
MLRWLLRGLGLLLVLAIGGIAATVRLDRPAAEVEARWARPPSKFVDVDGLRVHVRDRGKGPVVVLVHGSNSSLFTWEGWARALETDHRVITLDLPGHGLTGPHPRARYGPRDMADVVHGVVEALGVGRFSLAGNSMGGHVAIAYTLAHPERVERLILIDAAGLPREEPLPFAFRLSGLPVVGRLVRWTTPRFMVTGSLREVYGDPSKVTDALVDQFLDLNLRAGNREATRLRFLTPPDDIAGRLGELRLPVLILWGGRDRWILPRYGERFRDAIAGSRLVVFDSLGHVPMEEDPAATVRVAREFLAQANGG